MKDWHDPKVKRPPDGVEVLTMDSTGHVQSLMLKGNLWWFPDMSMYVYYVPTFWTEKE